MIRYSWLWVTLLFAGALPSWARAEEVPEKQRKAVDKGLELIAQKQRRDGYWEAEANRHMTNMTARAGLVLLMSGSTTREGKYSAMIDNAVGWLLEHTQADGLICNKDDAAEAKRYMEGHGMAMLFLASVYAQEPDGKRRKQLKDVLVRAVDYCGKAQTESGGWNYVDAKTGQQFDANEVALSQFQGLGACLRNGIGEPKPIMDKGLKYLEKCTSRRGGVVFSLAAQRDNEDLRGESDDLTAAAILCSFCAGQYDSDLVKKWIKYCGTSVTLAPYSDSDRFALCYYAQVIHSLGDNRYGRLFPDSRAGQRLVWSKNRQPIFDQLVGSQGQDGSWTWSGRGPILMTTLNLTVLQLDSTALPIYRPVTQQGDKK
jgi:hypothetical protein